MKHINTIKKLNIIIALIFVISLMFSNCSQAIGNVFSDAEDFLNKRRSNIKYNK